MFIIIDGIDGSCKSTVLAYWAAHLAEQGKRVFSLKSYWQTNHCHPLPQDLGDADVVISAEPTTVWAGAAIRQELIRQGTDYTARTIAEAYALDRMILYKRLLLPLLAQGKIILQDRSVSTSLCYQSVQDNGLPMQEIASLPGNAFALEHAPQHLVLATIPPQIALSRIGKRDDKQDNAIFERESFLIAAHNQFLSPAYQRYFTERGTTIHHLNTNLDRDSMKQESISLLDSILCSSQPPTLSAKA